MTFSLFLATYFVLQSFRMMEVDHESLASRQKT